MNTNDQHIDDIELIQRISEGNHAAYDLLYDRFFEEIYIHIYNKTKDYELTKDLTHDVFLKLWENRDALTHITNIRGYLYITARNKVLDLIKHNKIVDTYYQSFLHTYKLVESTDFRIREKQIEMIISEAVDSLPAKMRQVFELSRKQDLSYQEIADQLAISEKTVKTQIHNALKILRKKLHPYTHFFLF